MMALKLFFFALSCTVAVAQEASQLLPFVLKPPGINMEAVAPTPRRLSEPVKMDTALLRSAMTEWCTDPTTAEGNHGHIKDWDVSGVTDMSYLLNDYCSTRDTFNEDLSAWNVSAVTNMQEMFFLATLFNQPLSAWDVSKVISMAWMFFGTSSFNKPLSEWDVSKVTTMAGMFSSASAFNQPLSAWDVSKVTDMGLMFHQASSFNQPLSAWDVSKVTDMRHMFREASSYNQPLSAWDVSKVTDMGLMFYLASSYNQPLSAWDVSKVTNMRSMFNQASSFNQVLCWDVTGKNTQSMLSSPSSVNGDCTQCVANQYRVDTATCAPCAAGSFSSPSTGSTGADSCSAPTQTPVNGACFHGNGTVLLESGNLKRFSELSLGDIIKTSDEEGHFSFSPVLNLPHAGNFEPASFLTLTTETGKMVDMTSDHIVPKCDKDEVTAGELVVGDCVFTVDGKETLMEIFSTAKTGVFTAITRDKFIVVDGVVASPFSKDSDPAKPELDYKKYRLELAEKRERHLSVRTSKLQKRVQGAHAN